MNHNGELFTVRAGLAKLNPIYS